MILRTKIERQDIGAKCLNQKGACKYGREEAWGGLTQRKSRFFL